MARKRFVHSKASVLLVCDEGPARASARVGGVRKVGRAKERMEKGEDKTDEDLVRCFQER